MNLAACIIITLVGMIHIPASPSEPVTFTKMVIAIVFIVLAWVLFILGRGGL